jgi:hypothetical protein
MSTMSPNSAFWELKPLEALSAPEWESLCDGCGKCCLEKLEDARTGEISYTEVACAFLDVSTCRCRRYRDRRRDMPACEKLTPANVRQFDWLPATCAYRLLSQGRPLPWWHHLVSGDRELVHQVGGSARGRAVPLAQAGRLEHHIVTWPK